MTVWTRMVATAALALAPATLSAAPPPPIGGTISVEVAGAPADGDPAPRPYVEAAARALAGRGFTVIDEPGHAAWVAELRLRGEDVGTSVAKLPAGRATAGPGAAVGAGAGVTIPFSTGQSKLVPLRRTRLELRIHKRGEPAAAWTGAALTVRPAETRTGTDEAVATALSEALLRDYPAQPTDVLGVP